MARRQRITAVIDRFSIEVFKFIVNNSNNQIHALLRKTHMVISQILKFDSNKYFLPSNNI